jgi:CDP-paratose 2-epimerase
MSSRHNRVLVTGGAGFVGSSVALALKKNNPSAQVIAFDSLHRRGSELNLGRLREYGRWPISSPCRSPRI